LTVCLVVLGHHVPQLAFLDILLGSEPVLTQPERLYQRLLAGDPDEASVRAEENLREQPLASYFDEVAIAALALAEADRARGALSDEQHIRVAESAMLLIDNLEEWDDSASNGNGAEAEADVELPPHSVEATEESVPEGRILCAGARGELDEAAAAMLAQLLERRGADVGTLPHECLQSAKFRALDLDGVTCVVLSYMNADSLAHARFMVRRLRRRLPDATIIVGFWTFPPEEASRRDPLSATGADHVVTTLSEAFDAVIERATPKAPDAVQEFHARAGAA
jgi:hypothetical protein